MQVFNLTAHEQSYNVTIRLSKYHNGRTAIELYDAEDGEPYATATVNIDNVLLADNEVLIKDYSENEGMLDFLIHNNIVTPTPNGVQSGFVWIPVAILNDKSVWGETSPYAYVENQLDPAPDEININTGKSMWIIKDYRLWADNYQQALELLPMIESY